MALALPGGISSGTTDPPEPEPEPDPPDLPTATDGFGSWDPPEPDPPDPPEPDPPENENDDLVTPTGALNPTNYDVDDGNVGDTTLGGNTNDQVDTDLVNENTGTGPTPDVDPGYVPDHSTSEGGDTTIVPTDVSDPDSVVQNPSENPTGTENPAVDLEDATSFVTSAKGIVLAAAAVGAALIIGGN